MLLELAPPPEEQRFGELMLATKLGEPFLAALDLAAQVELEFLRESTRRLSGHSLLRLGSASPGVDSIQ